MTSRRRPASVASVLAASCFVLLALLGAAGASADAAGDEPNRKQLEKDLKQFQKDVVSAPEDSESWYNLGLAHARLGSWKDAAEALAKATTLNAERGAAWLWLGRAQIELGQGETALASLAQAKEKGVPEASSEMARAYMAAEKWDDAIEAYKEALKVDGARKGPLYNQLGIAHLRKGDTQGAIRWFERNVEAAPDSPDTYYNLGQMYRKVWQDTGMESSELLAKASEALGRAAQMDPKNTTALFLAGEALILEGRNAEGLAMMDRYIAADPGGKRSGAEVFAAAQQYKREVKVK